MPPKINEFYLNVNIQGSFIYRVALGDLIPSTQRTIFTPPASSEPNCMTGEVGFMDVMRCREVVPHGKIREPEYRMETVLSLLGIGIEPKYQGKGYARELLERADYIAQGWHLDTIVACSLIKPRIRKLCRKNGYRLYYSAKKGVKVL